MNLTSNISFELKNLSLGFSEVLINGFSYSIDRGNLVMLLGKNGIGKSTLLKTIAGLIQPISGTIEINKNAIAHLNFTEKAKLISFVNTQRISHPNLSVYSLVEFGRYPYHNLRNKFTASDTSEIDNALDLLHITHLKNKQINYLSDGEYQKAVLAKAIAQQTPIILLDEPTSYLDYPSKRSVFGILKTIAKDLNKFILVSTHDIELAIKFSEEFWMVENKSIHISNDSKYVLTHFNS